MLMFDLQIKALGSDTTTEDFVDLIDSLKSGGKSFNVLLLVELLSERHAIYKNRSSITSSRMRGYLLQAFHDIGMPSKGLPYLLEELETSFYPYIVAAAAKAVRGIKEPHPGIAAFLNKSIYNIWQADAIVNYSSYLGPYIGSEQTTALKEIFKSLQWLGGRAQYILPELYHLEAHLSENLSSENRTLLSACIHAIESSHPLEQDCCTIPIEIYTQNDLSVSETTTMDLSELILQNQDGIEWGWNDYFKGNYTVLSFFYTKCHNPRKCIQTIHNLVQVQKKLLKDKQYAGVQTAAITYDPEYDTSSVLKTYGERRKYYFNEQHNMFRVVSGMETLIETLNIGVNYKGNEVNVHRIEVYIVNPEGKIEKSFLRFQAADQLIMGALDELLCTATSGVKEDKKQSNTTLLSRFSTVVLPVLIAFFPKCPMCWMAYLNLIGISSIVSIDHKPWLVYVFMALALINLGVFYRLAKKRNGLWPFYMACGGTLLLGLNYWLDLGVFAVLMGLVLTLFSTLLNSLSFKRYHKLRHFINEKWLTLKYA